MFASRGHKWAGLPRRGVAVLAELAPLADATTSARAGRTLSLSGPRDAKLWMRHLGALLLVLVAVARDAAALRTPLITAKIIGGEKRVAETFGPYEHLRAASLDECIAAAPFFCDKLQAPLDDEIQRGLDAMLGSANGVRGFFLAWNNDPDFVIADESPPPPGLLSAMEQARGTPDPTGCVCMRVCVRACACVHGVE